MKFENGPHGYTLFKVGERSAGGAFQFEPEWGVTPAWQVYFEVTNFEASAARACALGGEQGWWRDAPNAGRIGVVLELRCVPPLGPSIGDRLSFRRNGLRSRFNVSCVGL